MREDHEDESSRDSLSKGLAEAFQGDARSSRRSMGSVLRLLQERAESSLVGVDLSDDADPVVAVTEEVKKLRDPSGRYHIVGEIGRGGMGVVYHGRDQDLGRDVAMKVLKDEYSSRPEVLSRFVEEAQIGGQLQHPGIVPVYEIGLQAGERPYFAMKLVRGETLASQLSARRALAEDRRRFLGIFEQVCQTLSYAHARRVVHRDLKPANVMIGAFGEVQVVDWGFAKVLARGGVADEAVAEAARSDESNSVIETVRSRPDSGSQSIAGSMFGTPAYMSPEQALGDIDALDERSDVFGLGAVLCEILTGDPPYRSSEGDVIRQAAQAELEPAHARLRACGADHELVELCVECLARSRRARPRSAKELADRVGRYLTSVEERARDAEVRAREARWRQRLTLVAAGSASVVVVLAAVGWTWVRSQAEAQRGDVLGRIATARASAEAAVARADADGIDEQRWTAAVDAAEVLVRLVPEAPWAATQRSAASSLGERAREGSAAAAVERERIARDETLIARLEGIISAPKHFDKTLSAGRFDVLRDGRFGVAIQDYLGDVALTSAPEADVLAALRAGDVDVALAAHLDYWALLRDDLARDGGAADGHLTARLRNLARALDIDEPARNLLRGLLEARAPDLESVAAFAREVDLRALGAGGARVLTRALVSFDLEDQAVATLERARVVFPDDTHLHIESAAVLAALEEPQLEAALHAIDRARALRPGSANVLHTRALLLERLRRFDDAKGHFEELVELDPSSEQHWRMHLGNDLLGMGRTDDALAELERAVELDRDDALALAHLGRGYVKAAKYGDAERLLRRAVELHAEQYDERDIELELNFANALLATDRVDEASDVLEGMLELDPDSAAAHASLATIAIRKGRMRDVKEHIERAIELEPDRPGVAMTYARYLSGTGRTKDAQPWHEKAVALEPERLEALMNLATNLRLLGRFEESLDVLERAERVAPTLSLVDFNRAHSLVGLDRYPEAVAALRRTVEKEPSFLRGHVDLIAALIHLDRREEAVEVGQAARPLFPDDANLHYTVGHTLFDLGRFDEAVEPTEVAHALNPKDARILNQLANLRERQGLIEETIELLRAAIAIRRSLPDAHVNLGRIMLEQGDLEGARPYYEQANKLFSRGKDDFSKKWAELSRADLGVIEEHTRLREQVLSGVEPASDATRFACAVRLGESEGRCDEVLAMTKRALDEHEAQVLFPEHGCFFRANRCVARLASGAVETTEAVRLEALEVLPGWILRDVANATRLRDAGEGAGRRALRNLRGYLEDEAFAPMRSEDWGTTTGATRSVQWTEVWQALQSAL